MRDPCLLPGKVYAVPKEEEAGGMKKRVIVVIAALLVFMAMNLRRSWRADRYQYYPSQAAQWGDGDCAVLHKTVMVWFKSRAGTCWTIDDPWYRYNVIQRLWWEYFS